MASGTQQAAPPPGAFPSVHSVFPHLSVPAQLPDAMTFQEPNNTAQTQTLPTDTTAQCLSKVGRDDLDTAVALDESAVAQKKQDPSCKHRN